MRQLRLLGLTLIAAFALAAMAAATASATEPGLLPLEKEFKVPVSVKGETNVPSLLKAGGQEVKCSKLKLEKGELGKGEAKHITLGTATLTFTECKNGALACQSLNIAGTKDPAETILAAVGVRFINVLKESTLEPGVGVIILEPAGTIGSIKFECGGLLIEVKGVAKGLIIKASLTVDITEGTLDFIAAGEKCDTSDTVCEELAKKPYEAKTKKVFEAATQEAELPITLGEMALLDD
jgi:hypothetical protein